MDLPCSSVGQQGVSLPPLVPTLAPGSLPCYSRQILLDAGSPLSCSHTPAQDKSPLSSRPPGHKAGLTKAGRRGPEGSLLRHGVSLSSARQGLGGGCGRPARLSHLPGGWGCVDSVCTVHHRAASWRRAAGARGLPTGVCPPSRMGPGVPPGLGTHVDLLRGEGADAHACGVGLHHAVDVADVLGGDAQPCAHAAHRAVG